MVHRLLLLLGLLNHYIALASPTTAQDRSRECHITVQPTSEATTDSTLPDGHTLANGAIKVASVHEAADHLALLNQPGTDVVDVPSPFVVCLAPGIHNIKGRTLELDERHNHPHGGHIVWQGSTNLKDKSTSLVNGVQITKWAKCNDGIHCPGFEGYYFAMAADIPGLNSSNYPFRTMWNDGIRVPRVSMSPSEIGGGTWKPTATGYITSEPITTLGSASANEIELRWPSQIRNWIEPRCLVSGVTTTGNSTSITVEPTCWANLYKRNNNKTAPVPSLIENVLPPSMANNSVTDGTFASDSLYIFYKPANGTMPNMVYAGLPGAIVNSINAVHLDVSNITYNFSSWRQPSAPGGYVPSQTAVGGWGEPTGLVRFNHASDLTVASSVFGNIGSAYALEIGGASSDVTVGLNVFHDLSGGAVKLGNVDESRSTSTNPANFDIRYTLSQNYIDSVALEFRGAAAVFAGYVASTEISHNTISETGYTGISLGWGWGSHVFGNQTFASDNHVLNNYLINIMSSLNDGGCSYTLGPQPNSTVEGNYCEADHAPVVGFFYHDNGSRYFTTKNNVAKSGPAPCVYLQGCCNSPAYDIHVSDLWCQDTAPVRNECAPQNCTIDNSTLYIVKDGDKWPDAAQSIINTAGANWY